MQQTLTCRCWTPKLCGSSAAAVLAPSPRGLPSVSKMLQPHAGKVESSWGHDDSPAPSGRQRPSRCRPVSPPPRSGWEWLPRSAGAEGPAVGAEISECTDQMLPGHARHRLLNTSFGMLQAQQAGSETLAACTTHPFLLCNQRARCTCAGSTRLRVGGPSQRLA